MAMMKFKKFFIESNRRIRMVEPEPCWIFKPTHLGDELTRRLVRCPQFKPYCCHGYEKNRAVEYCCMENTKLYDKDSETERFFQTP